MLLAERMVGRRRHRGFATATVLGILSVIGMLTVAALHDALFGEQLAGSRLLQQRAVAAAELGVNAAVERIGELDQPAGFALAQQPDAGQPDTFRVAVRHLASSPPPAGTSASHLLLHHFEVESAGHTVRGVQARVVQGISRLMAAAPAPAEPST